MSRAAGCAVVSVLALIAAAPAVTPQARVRVLLLYDMEGVSGAVRGADVNFGSPTYQAARESLTEEVNAAIRGLQKAGATEIVITDGHGSGNPDPDYVLERMPPGAKFDLRDVPYDPYVETMAAGFDAMVAIAMHGRAGGQAFLAHTYNGHTKWVMAGHDMNESMLVAASAARFDIPLVLVTGDDVLQKEIAAFSPNTSYVVVKKAVSVDQAEPRARADVSREIEAAAERALRERTRVRPWRPAEISKTFENRYSYILPEQAAVAIGFPGAEAVDNKTVRLRTRSFLEAYFAFRALAGFTGLASQRSIVGWIRELPGGPEMIQQAQRRLPSRAERSFAPTGEGIPRGYGRHGYR